jgi:hypothetical protein
MGGAAMGVVRVNPASVAAYQSAAQAGFASIHQDLTTLVNDVVGVHYFGPNAQSFKQSCGELAAEVANGLSRQLGGMAAAVNAATSNIASSLGAARSTLVWEPRPFTAPAAAAGDGSVDVDPTALLTLKDTVDARLGSVRAALDSHLSSLRSTDWAGNAKEQVIGEVSRRTTASVAEVAEAQVRLSSFIQQQVDDVLRADSVS